MLFYGLFCDLFSRQIYVFFGLLCGYVSCSLMGSFMTGFLDSLCVVLLVLAWCNFFGVFKELFMQFNWHLLCSLIGNWTCFLSS